MSPSTAAHPRWYRATDGRMAWVEVTQRGYLVHYADGEVASLGAR